MRNLKNLRHQVVEFDDINAQLTATAWNTRDNTIICAAGPTESDPKITLWAVEQSTDAIPKVITSWDALCPSPDLPCDKILDLHYLSETSTVCLILTGGDIVLVKDDDTSDRDAIEIVGSVDEGIAAAAWSPDDESLAIYTRANTMIFMTRDFDPVSTVTLSADDVRVSAHVDVGWGKKETQFKGRHAKALQDPTVPETIDKGILSEFDSGEAALSWRGDGAYVVLNSVQDSKARLLRVFTREGVLDSVSEPVDGLEGAVTWRPAGNLIACIQRLHDRIDVVFFERNGLRHGQFALRLDQEACKQQWTQNIHLAWNIDSTVLMVRFTDRIQLWTMSNYHYSLKQEIVLSTSVQPRCLAAWHPERPLHLILAADKTVTILHYATAISGGSAIPPHDAGLVAVIDGREIRLTPLARAGIPPPMCLVKCTVPYNAIDVAFDRAGTRMAVLSAEHIAVYNLNLSVSDPVQPSDPRIIALDYPCLRQLAFDEHDLVILVGNRIHRVDHQGQQQALDTPATSTITSLVSSTSRDSIAYQDESGAIYDLSSNAGSGKTLLAKLPMASLWAEVWSFDSQTITFGLSSSGTLYGIGKDNAYDQPHEKLSVKNCSSFLLTKAHLVYTTTTHLIKFVHLRQGNLDIPLDEPEKDERCRSIERGAKLVAVVPSKFAVTLQMPRGNIETIYPRALVLAGIRRAIESRDYKQAFVACRNHRVDMNILHDFAPAQFMSSISSFIQQVAKVSYIDLFLSSLREEDVTETMYKDTLGADRSNTATTASQEKPTENTTSLTERPASKVNRICDALIAVLVNRKDRHLQNLVTAHVCKSPPDLEAGLTLVAELRKDAPDMVEQAIEHICFLADVNRLYETALGLYDLDVALLVAQQSQKDPREYLPHLQRLKDLPEHRRQFTIDNELRRYAKALDHLYALDDFEMLKTHTVKHALYSEASTLYRYQPQRLNDLLKLHAEHLSAHNQHEEAGIAYESLGDYKAASDSYYAAVMWRECLACAALAGQEKTSLDSLATSLVESLLESKDYSAAATIYNDHLANVEGAVSALGKGYYFSDAIRLLAMHKRQDLLETSVDAALAEAFGSMTEMLAEMRTQLHAQIPRLRDLRVKKQNDALAFYAGTRETNAGGDVDIPDDISLASTTMTNATGTTLMTRYTDRQSGVSTLDTNATRRTSKNRRREERKRARGKKGSVYEEEYLVNSISRLIVRLDSVQDEVKRLAEGLMRRRMREQAIAVSAAFEEVLSICKACLSEVFETRNVPNETAAAEADDIEAPDDQPVKADVPKIREFARLSLLG